MLSFRLSLSLSLCMLSKANYQMKMENVNVTNGNKINIVDFFGLVVEDLFLYFCSIACSSSQFARKFLEHIQLFGFIDRISDKLKNCQILKLVALGTAACFSVPVALFIVFAIISVLLTFSGFVILEIFLLLLGGLCLYACLFSMIIVITALAVTIGTFHFIAIKLKVY